MGEGASICGRITFSVVLRMPCRGRFICPLAVAGLGLRYLSISSSDMLGHPFKKPRRVALRSVEILGLHNDWWANLTLLARVEIEWAKLAASCGKLFVNGRCIDGDDCSLDGIGSVHKSVIGSLYPRIITFVL